MWLHENKEISKLEDFPEGTFGFVYEIEHLPTGKKYLGRKQLIFNRTLPPLKGYKRKRKVQKESDWLTYYSSHKELKELRKSGKVEDFKRTILRFVPTKKLLTYYENRYLFENKVIEPDSNYINDNIEGRYFRKDFL